MKAREYDVLARAVEEGIAAGWQHAHKHTETPSPEAVHDQIHMDVMTAICEWFTFDDTLEEEA